MIVDWPNPTCCEYKGRKLTLNGESHAQLPGLFPTDVHFGVPTKLPYVSWAATSYKHTSLPTVASRLLTNPHSGYYNPAFLLHTSPNCVRCREEAFTKLADVGAAAATGSCRGISKFAFSSSFDPANYMFPNPNVIISPEVNRTHWTNNVLPDSLPSPYRFTLCMENTATPNYITEKILTTFLVGAVPIYYGTSEIFEMFNPDRFTFFDVDAPDAALNLVQELESDREKHLAFKSKPMLRDGEETLKKFFSWTDNVGDGQLRRTALNMLGISPELPKSLGMKGGRSFWHDIDTWHDESLKLVNFVTEISFGTTAKMEVNKETIGNPIKQDTRKDGSLRYYTCGEPTFNYGMIPQTFEDPASGGDNDPWMSWRSGALH
jgi:hypothetical protein